MRVEHLVEFRLIEQRSRFFAVLFPAASIEDVEAMLKTQRSEHRKAHHHCWAARFPGAGAAVEKAKDDGEVGHPGRVLIELLRRRDLEGAILVSRVFGGIKLGVGGVSRAFRAAGEGAVAAYLEGGT